MKDRIMSLRSDNKVEEVHLNTALSPVGSGSALCDNPIVRRQMPEDEPKEERHTEITEEDYEKYAQDYMYNDEKSELTKLYKWKEKFYKYEEDYNLTDELVAPI
jgi:hypothetical protein